MTTLADHYAAATGKYGLFNATFMFVGQPLGETYLWQNCVIKSDGSEYQLSIYYDSAIPDMGVTQDDVGKEYEFRIKIRKNGNFRNMTGHINGPAQEH